MTKDSDHPNRLLDLGVTPIPVSNDIQLIRRSIEKITSAVNKSARHTERIPEIQKKVEKTGEKVVELSAKFGGMDDRLNKVESKVEEGHNCQKTSSIDGLKAVQRDSQTRLETVVMDNVTQYARIENLTKQVSDAEADVDEIKKTPRKMAVTLVGVILSILAGAGGAIWFLAELNSKVEFERSKREDQFKRIEVQIREQSEPQLKKVGGIHKRITELEGTIRAVKEAEREYDNLCIDMNRSERKAMSNVLRRRGRKIPGSCLE